jgi:hypothetical protein
MKQDHGNIFASGGSYKIIYIMLIGNFFLYNLSTKSSLKIMLKVFCAYEGLR